ncbi:thiamine pyrophosphate-dependent enzyme [Desulfobaculum bizertense]|uniref:thiamine pyrophosphate-dependent enzyme n=1 Tax=Desulfobaculum bizertense TaxID=376490 RepID=UPI00202B8C08|nr:thiamine pyrophosphate-dependent enzyme [Desulfobaculum bizertense]
MLPGHCDRCKVPGVDATSGSLGQGLSIACGLALSSRLRSKNQRVFCVIGDGEAAEGQIWEAAQFASHFELDNLILFLDWNKMQIDGPNDKVMSLGDPVQKFQSFGWRACKVEGDNVLQLDEAISTAINLTDSKPHIIVLDTVKGGNIQCVSSLANNHCIGFSNEMYEKALKELDAQASDLERGVR